MDSLNHSSRQELGGKTFTNKREGINMKIWNQNGCYDLTALCEKSEPEIFRLLKNKKKKKLLQGTNV